MTSIVNYAKEQVNMNSNSTIGVSKNNARVKKNQTWTMTRRELLSSLAKKTNPRHYQMIVQYSNQNLAKLLNYYGKI